MSTEAGKRVEHTPGPWEVRDGSTPRVTMLRVHARRGVVAALVSHPDDDSSGEPEEQRANARLIAAAPDLYDALADIRDNYDHDEDAHKYGTHCRVCVASAALAKVSGG